MKINREQFLNDLEAVKAGLSPREFIEQSSCFVFQNGMVMTFNDEVACRKEIGLKLTGAVQATSLLAILDKLDDPELKVRENDKGELEFRGKSKGFGVTKDAEIFLPIDRVEMPEKWRDLPKEFIEAIGIVQHCVSSDESRFHLTCVHVHPDYIEACDNLQVMRCNISTGLKRPILIRGSSIKHITDLAVDKVALTKSWIHFKNQSGLVFSCRRYNEEYPSLSKAITFEGHPITIPKGMKEASERAAVFASDKSGDPLVVVKLSNGVIRIKGEGITGWYSEVKKIAYDGPPLEFLIAPDLLRHISENYTDAHIIDSRLKVTGGGWVYVTMLGEKEDQEKTKTEEEDTK
jgi:DNA polymerase III sliding clamp (beta) subunit (PCNA family)